MKPWEICPRQTPGALCGRPLRYLLVHLLRKAEREGTGAMTVHDLVAACEAAGVVFDRRPSKLISDALRWEIRRGRVKKLERGVYAFEKAPRSTMWRIDKRVGEYIDQLGRLRERRLRDTSCENLSALAGSPVYGQVPLRQ